MDGRSRLRVTWLLVCAGLQALAGCTSVSGGTPDARAVASPGKTTSRTAIRPGRMIDLLAARNTADSLAAAALLAREGRDGSDRALMFADRATGHAPNRPELVWLELQFCRQRPTCDVSVRSERLRTLDPDNAASWDAPLQAAHERGDTAAVDAALQGMAKQQRFDIYWNLLISRATRAATSVTGDANVAATSTTVIGQLAARAVPPFKAVSGSCNGERLKRQDVVTTCRAVARVLEHGDTYVVEAIGQNIGLRVWPQGSEEFKAISERRRVSRYRLSAAATLHGQTLDEKAASEWLDVIGSQRREQDADLELLRRRGVSPDPPADWHEDEGRKE
jgi:hypothetical protein